MVATLEDPAGYGWLNVRAPDATFRVYHPAPSGRTGGRAPLEDGSYPLVVFAHGERNPSTGRDPEDPDPERDFQRWTGVLHLLARTGIVVASVQMNDVLTSPEAAARRIEAVEQWMYRSWEHESALVRGVSYETVRDGRPTRVRDHRRGPLGLAAHSFGIGGCARVASQRGFVKGVAGIAATWREQSWRNDIARADDPALFVAGLEDFLTGPNSQPYPDVDPPRHLAAVQGADHWDWFDDDGLSPPPGADPDRCRAGYRIAGELLAVFFHRYLNERSDLPPSLLTMRRRWRWVPPRRKWRHDTAGRPSLGLSGSCGFKVLWDVPERGGWDEPVGTTGTRTLGRWDGRWQVPPTWS